MQGRDAQLFAECPLEIARDCPCERADEDALGIDAVALDEALDSTLDSCRLPGPWPGYDGDHRSVALDQLDELLAFDPDEPGWNGYLRPRSLPFPCHAGPDDH
jgi:hypothetical protein